MVTGDRMAGVVCLQKGVWPMFDDESVETFGEPNVLAPTAPTIPSRSTRTNTIFVEVELS